MSDLQFKPATRQGIKPLIGLYAESGCGKTMSALLLARGIVGDKGRIGMIDTESGRGSLYADVIPSGYETAQLTSFSPASYCDAMEATEKAGFDILIIDSMSHEWEGTNGVLDMAGENEARSGKAGLHNWRVPKMEHAKMVLRLLRSPLPIIVCLRAKYKSRQAKNEKGKTEIVKDDHTSPIQAEDFIFEMTAHAEIMGDHSIHLTKCSHPDLRSCFPQDYKEPLNIKHGQLIAAWCNNPSGGKPADVSVSGKPKDAPDIVSLKKRIAEVAYPKMPDGSAKEKLNSLNAWLVENAVIDANETLSDLTPEKLTHVLRAVESAFARRP
jgi:hypothetical protein